MYEAGVVDRGENNNGKHVHFVLIGFFFVFRISARDRTTEKNENDWEISKEMRIFSSFFPSSSSIPFSIHYFHNGLFFLTCSIHAHPPTHPWKWCAAQAFEELEDLLAKHNICIAVKEKLVKDSGVAEEIAYDNIVQKLLTKPRARGKFYALYFSSFSLSLF